MLPVRPASLEVQRVLLAVGQSRSFEAHAGVVVADCPALGAEPAHEAGGAVHRIRCEREFRVPGCLRDRASGSAQSRPPHRRVSSGPSKARRSPPAEAGPAHPFRRGGSCACAHYRRRRRPRRDLVVRRELRLLVEAGSGGQLGRLGAVLMHRVDVVEVRAVVPHEHEVTTLRRPTGAEVAGPVGGGVSRRRPLPFSCWT